MTACSDHLAHAYSSPPTRCFIIKRPPVSFNRRPPSRMSRAVSSRLRSGLNAFEKETRITVDDRAVLTIPVPTARASRAPAPFPIADWRSEPIFFFFRHGTCFPLLLRF